MYSTHHSIRIEYTSKVIETKKSANYCSNAQTCGKKRLKSEGANLKRSLLSKHLRHELSTLLDI